MCFVLCSHRNVQSFENPTALRCSPTLLLYLMSSGFLPLSEFIGAAAVLTDLNTNQPVSHCILHLPLKINFALTKAECSCEPDGLGALCCCCLLLFRSSLSMALFHLGCFLSAQTSCCKLSCSSYSKGSGALGFSVQLQGSLSRS